jgi:arylsulfatase A-like enzyme
MRGPGLPRGRRITTPLYTLDLYATLAELAGLESPEACESRSLIAALHGDAAAGRSTIGGLYKDSQRMITDGKWKLIEYEVDGMQRSQLFALAADPHELHDLSLANTAQSYAQLERLRTLLEEWQREIGDQWMLRRNGPVAVHGQAAAR